MHINKNFQLNLSSIAYGGLVIAMFIVLAMSCNTSVGNTEGDKNIDEAIEMLEYVFEGTYNKRIIRESMDILFLKYGIEPVKANYLKIGNTLIEYRKQSSGKFQEMDLINDMILSAKKSSDITIDKQLVKSVKKFSEF